MGAPTSAEGSTVVTDEFPPASWNMRTRTRKGRERQERPTGRPGAKPKPLPAGAAKFTGKCNYCGKSGHEGSECRKRASDKAIGVDTRKDKGASNREGQEGVGDDDDELGNMELHSDDEQGLNAVGCEDDNHCYNHKGDGDFEAQVENYIQDVERRRQQPPNNDIGDNDDDDWKTVRYRKGIAQTIRSNSRNWIEMRRSSHQ